MLVGRDGECAQLREVLDASRAGHPQVVALRGDPGIGKTRLLEYAASVADGFRVIRIQGHEAEREIPFAALSMLVGPLVTDVAALPEVQAAALEGALNLGPAMHGDRLGIAAATLAVLAAASDQQPILLAVDDVHLVDAPTLETLFFAFRRAHTERLAVVMTAREERDISPVVEQWLESIRQIRVDGLDLESARRLTAHRGALPAAVWTASGGNPLALLEMTAPNSAIFLDEPVQLSARLLRAYGRRLTGLGTGTRDALLLLAVAGRANDVLDDALEHRGLKRSDLEPAEDNGLVVLEPEGVLFTHPLVCSAVYHSASPAVKRAAHQTMVAAYTGRSAPGAAERRAFHLAAATVGPDEAAAQQLADAAKGAASRHSHTTAAALFEKAAWLSPRGAARTQRIIEAALAGQAAGTLDAAGPLLDLAIAETDDEDLRTAAQHLQCRIQMWAGRPAQARDQLLDLADRTADRYPEWSAMMRAQAAIVSIALGEQRLAIGMAARAVEISAHLPDQLALPVLVTKAVTQAINGDVETARALLERCDPFLPDCDPLSIDQLLVLAALAHAALEEITTARHWLETAVRKTRGAQAAGLLPFQLSWLTLVCWLDGDWVSALANGYAAVQIAEETGWATELPNCLIALATVEATLGHDDDAREHADLAARLGAGGTEARIFAAQAARVLGLLELGAGRPTEAAEHLGVAGEFALAGRMGDTVLFNWAGNLTEALVRAGRPEQAVQALRSAAREAEPTGRPTANAVVARCRGLLADTLDEGRAAFDEALTWHERAATQPFELARTQLCYGEFLRRHQLRTDARTQLRAALATFGRLGAVAWIRRAEAELQATGLTSRKRAPVATESLTPQELQVAIVVADGVTNAEAAARLFLSAKTIEFHLSNVYRKLGIRSRAELVKLVLAGLLPEQATREIRAGDAGTRPTAHA